MKKMIIIVLSVFIIISALVILIKGDAIFQRGNPIPYIAAMTKLSEENTYVIVDGSKGIFITEVGEKSQLFEYIEKQYNVKFVDQYGSISFFKSDDMRILVDSEVYWSKYMVWSISEE